MRQNENILFKNWHWGECLDCLDNVVRHSDSLVLVSGAINSGKTILKQELINLLGVNFKIFATFGDQKIGVTTFIRQITTGFDLPWNDTSAPTWSELQKAIFSQPNCRWVLLVDDAEKLSWDNLNALIRLYTIVNAEGSQFSLILFADVSLEESLKQSVLKEFFENKFQIIKLKALTFEQTLEYLNSININFDNKTLKKIHHAAEGSIGRVKQLAMNELNIKNINNIKDSNMIKDVLVKIINPPVLRTIFCGGLLVVAYVLFGIVQKDNVQTKIELEPATSQSQINIAKNESSILLEQPQPIVQENIIEPPININTEKVQNIQQSVFIPEELYQKLYVDLKSNLQEYIQAELSKLEQQVTELKLSVANVNYNNNANTKISTRIHQTKLEHTENNLLNIARNRYTLQIMASKNEQSVKKLFNNHPHLLSKAKYFRGKFSPEQGSTWFVVVHGSYADRELAYNDIKNLPLDIQHLKPIVRDYGSIHQIINNKSLNK